MARVVYIDGFGRSGSTILDRTLGAAAGVCSCGELRLLWMRYVEPERTCSCGALLRQCDFWRAVFGEAFGRMDLATAERYDALRARIQRRQTLRSHLMPRPAATRRVEAGERAEYVDALRRLYEAVAAVSGANVLIDSSKFAGYFQLLRDVPGLDLSVIHLVRDSRACAYSLTRVYASSVAMPMSRRRPLYSAQLWLRENLAAERLRLQPMPLTRVRYEDFARRPAAVTASLSRRFSIAAPDVSQEGVVHFGAAHVPTGNPSRFLTGEVRLREDDEWRSRLPRADARNVTLITWPLLLRYGYPLTVRP